MKCGQRLTSVSEYWFQYYNNIGIANYLRSVVAGGHVIDFRKYEEATVKLYLDLIHDMKPKNNKVELDEVIGLIVFLVNLGAIEKGSEFEIKLLGYCFKLLIKAKMNPDTRYLTALVLCGIESNQVNDFIPKFLTKMNYEEYLISSMNTQNNLSKTEAYLKLHINTEGITNIDTQFIQFFIQIKNNEVILRYPKFRN